MGQLELFAQRTFAEETERTTGGAAGWQDPPEIRLEKVTADGFLVIRRPQLLAHLPAPWPEAQPKHVENIAGRRQFASLLTMICIIANFRPGGPRGVRCEMPGVRCEASGPSGLRIA